MQRQFETPPAQVQVEQDSLAHSQVPAEDTHQTLSAQDTPVGRCQKRYRVELRLRRGRMSPGATLPLAKSLLQCGAISNWQQQQQRGDHVARDCWNVEDGHSLIGLPMQLTLKILLKLSNSVCCYLSVSQEPGRRRNVITKENNLNQFLVL